MPPGGSHNSGFGESRPGPNMAPNVQGTRSPQWSRWKCVMTIACTCGQPSCSRRRGRTPGPQSSNARPDPSTRYPDCAPPGFGQAGEHPTTVSFTGSVWHSPRVAEGAVDLLQRVPIFSDLDRKELERIASSMKQRTFQAGDTVTTETDLRCYGLTSWEFRPLVETHGSIAWKLLQAMSKTYQSPSL